MIEEAIQELESRSLARIASAQTAEEVEAVRVEALGRKGGLTQFGKEMGKLAPEERARIGKVLNGARETLEQAIEGRKKEFGEAALRARAWSDAAMASA